MGLDPTWSKLVTFETASGPVTWHVLDTGAGPTTTVLCVHGNPTWSYLWRELLEGLGPNYRVVAVDQSNMGYSERSHPRILAERIDELIAFGTTYLDGPLILAAHDWGGPVAVGAAAALNPVALILANTAVAKPKGVAVPPLIAAARSVVDLSCRRTPAFVRGTAQMTDARHRRGLVAPYRTPERREGVAQFVADIPLGPGDPSQAALEHCAEVLAGLDVPTLLWWGGKDPVFHDRFLSDLRRRVPHADVERLGDVGHLSPLASGFGDLVGRWLDQALLAPHGVAPGELELGSILDRFAAHAGSTEVLYRGPEGALSWAELLDRSATAAAALQAAGLEPGERVAMLVPPSIELLVATCAVWRCGAVPVVADASAGLGQLRRLVRAAGTTYAIGTPVTLRVAQALRMVPGASLAGFCSSPGVVDLRHAEGPPMTVATSSMDLAAVVHTSGATGPAKAVAYRHGALLAQRTALEDLLGLSGGGAFTTSFAAFMLLAPVLEARCLRPDIEVDAPSTLDFDTMASTLSGDAVGCAWLSPAAAAAIASSALGRHLPIPTTLLAGAPISSTLVQAMEAVTQGEVLAPWGMTECLPITDGTAPLLSGPLGGSSTGALLPGVSLKVLELDDDREVQAGSWGELVVATAWSFDGYDQSVRRTLDATVVLDGVAHHRTGDVGYLDDGLVIHLGRRAHVLFTPEGPLASVAVEQPIELVLGRRVAAVGVGPKGTQVVVIVVEDPGGLALAPAPTRDPVRAASTVSVAAVLTGRLPVDHRHQSKIDRAALAAAATTLLEGR